MKRLIEKELKYYRIRLAAHAYVYCDFHEDVQEHEYIDLNIVSVVISLDKAIQKINALSDALTNMQIHAELDKVKSELTKLDKKIIEQGDLIVKLLQKNESEK